MTKLAIPISRQDLNHYHPDLVIVTAMELATATDSEWAALSQRARARWLNRSLDVLVGVLSNQAIVERLPLLNRSLAWRLPHGATKVTDPR